MERYVNMFKVIASQPPCFQFFTLNYKYKKGQFPSPKQKNGMQTNDKIDKKAQFILKIRRNIALFTYYQWIMSGQCYIFIIQERNFRNTNAESLAYAVKPQSGLTQQKSINLATLIRLQLQTKACQTVLFQAITARTNVVTLLLQQSKKNRQKRRHITYRLI